MSTSIKVEQFVSGAQARAVGEAFGEDMSDQSAFAIRDKNGADQADSLWRPGAGLGVA